MLGKDGVLQLLSALSEGEEGENQGDDEGGPELRIGGSMKALPEGEERSIIPACTEDVIRPEEHPAHHDEEESGESGKWKVESFPFST